MNLEGALSVSITMIRIHYSVNLKAKTRGIKYAKSEPCCSKTISEDPVGSLLLTVPSAFNEAPLKYRKPMSRFYTMGLKVNEKVL